MEKLKNLGEWPPDDLLKKLTIISIILTPISYIMMMPFFLLSGFPSNQIMMSQLSFSGPFLKSLYAQITNLSAYVTAQSLDYVFMVCYGLLIFNLALFIGRKFEDTSSWRTMSYCIAIGGIIAPSLDAVENAFILMTLTDPLNFPDLWAVAHSCFASVKWIIILVALLWAIIAAIVNWKQK